MANETLPSFVDPEAPPGEVERTTIPAPQTPKVTSKAEVDALAPGAEFIDPTGVKRTKPYTVKDAESFKAVPEGATFVDPTGQARVKPTYEGLDYDTQLMVDMARGNEKQIEQILKGQFKGGELKREPLTNDMYVEREGKRYKPGRGSVLQRGMAATQAAALPALGSIPGMAAGPLGMAAGAATGEAFNQMALTLAGYPADFGDYAKAVAGEGALTAAGGMAGGIVGKGVEGAVGATKFGKDALKLGLGGSWLANLLGAEPAGAEIAGRLAGRGVMVPPSAWLKEAPYLRKVVETFDPEFRRQNVLQQSAKAYYDSEVPQVLEQMGVKAPAGKITEATAPVSVEPFGAAMLARAQTRLAAKDAQLDAAIAAAREQVASRGADPAARAATLSSLSVAEAEARKAAQEVVDNGFKAIQADVDNAVKLAAAGENPGDMVRLWEEKIRALRKGVSERAKKMYGAADAAAGDARPDVTMLRAEADEFLAQVPEDFKKRYPAIIQSIAEMEKDVTFGQLHNLRSMLRQDIDYTDLTPGVRAGSYKNFVNKINDVLFDKEAPPSLKEAAGLLKSADDFYAENIPKFKAESMRWITKQLEAGVPADATKLAQQFLQPGQTEEIRMLRQAGGAPLWSSVQAADTQMMLNQSKTLVPGETDGVRFAEQVLQRERDGILTAAYDEKTAATLREQAQRVLMMQGKIPIEARPGDTVSTLLRRADAIASEIKAQAEVDPLKLLNGELRRFDREARKIKGDFARQRKADPLSFLENQSAGAIAAAEKILGKPDLILHVARQFGEQSPEFEMLRQVWATRLFQRSVPQTSKLAGEFSGKISPEIQTLMFPGVSLKSAQTLARDMEFLMPAVEADTGGSMAANARILNPLTGINVPLVTPLLKVTGLNAAGRYALGKYYKGMTWAVTHPAFVRYIAAGLEGTPEMRDLVRRQFMKSYGDWVRQSGGAAGAMIGSTVELPQDPQAPPPPLTKAPPVKGWRELYKERYGVSP